jgi:hypothetical protein
MKRLIKFVLILAVIGLIAYAGYRYYLPSKIAEILISDEPSSLVPAEMQEKVEAVKLKIDKEIKKLPAFMKEHKIAYKDLQVMIDRADSAQFISAYNEIATSRFTSTNQVFDIGMKNVRISGYDLEIFRAAFVKNTSVEDIQKAIDQYENNEFLTNMSFPVIKETAKKLLDSKKIEIQAQLNKLN